MADIDQQSSSLPPPWDRIFSLGTRTFVWGLLLAVLYILQPFLLLIFLTFVFAYVQTHGTSSLKHRIPNRAMRVTIIGLVFLGTIVLTVFLLFPQIERQAADLIDNRQNYINGADRGLNDKLREYPAVWEYLSSVAEGDAQNDAAETDADQQGEVAPGGAAGENREETTKVGQGTGQPPPPPPPSGEPRIVKSLVDSLLGLGEAKPEEAIKRVFDVGSSVFAYLSSFLLSVLFSFLIVLDLPKLQRSVKGLANTKIGFIYTEVAENISTFARVLGRALEAQLFIAVTNTILTSIGMWILGIGNIPVLAAIVFLCSFIPVAGVFISSTPICLLALQSDGGFVVMMWAIAMILIVHAAETYVLNPKIYGHHMRMNPVLVLIVLTVGGKLFGIWGLVLGIPIMNYIFRHAIRFSGDQPVDVSH